MPVARRARRRDLGARGQRYYTEVVAVGVTLIGFVVTYIAHLGALAGSSYVLAGLVLVVLYGCLFLGLLFNVAVTVTGVMIAAHFITGIGIGLPFDALYYSTAIFGGAAVIGGISTYNLEYALRTNFLETRLLNELAERDGMTGSTTAASSTTTSSGCGGSRGASAPASRSSSSTSTSSKSTTTSTATKPATTA